MIIIRKGSRTIMNLFFLSYGSKPLRITEKLTIFACVNLRTLVFIRIYTLAADFYRSSPILGVRYSDPKCILYYGGIFCTQFLFNSIISQILQSYTAFLKSVQTG